VAKLNINILKAVTNLVTQILGFRSDVYSKTGNHKSITKKIMSTVAVLCEICEGMGRKLLITL
jgi:hypothetical protein